MDGLFPGMPWTNFHGQNIQWYLYKTAWLLNNVGNIREEVLAEIEKAKGEIADSLKAYEEKFSAMENEIKEQLASLMSETKDTISEALKRFDDFLAEQDKILGDFQAWVESSNLSLKAYVNYEIRRLEDLINTPIEGPVFNYFRQKMTSIQEALLDYYQYLRDHAYTTGFFDNSGITAGEFDSLGKTALEWDLEGKHIISKFKKLGPHWAYSAYTGLKVPVPELIYQLFQYHGVGLTTGQWDAMDYTAGQFDAAGYTAYQLDWTNTPLALDQ